VVVKVGMPEVILALETVCQPKDLKHDPRKSIQINLSSKEEKISKT
jgi:hypothetical protein